MGQLRKELGGLQDDTPITVRIDVSKGEDDWERRADADSLIEIMTDHCAGDSRECHACMFFEGEVDPAVDGTKDAPTMRALLEMALPLSGKKNKRTEEWREYTEGFLQGEGTPAADLSTILKMQSLLLEGLLLFRKSNKRADRWFDETSAYLRGEAK